MKETNSSDATKLQHLLLVGFLILATLGLVHFGFIRNMPVLGLLIPVIGIVSWIISRPALLFCSVLLVENAQLLIPGVTATIGVSELFQVLMLAWAVSDVSIRHQKRPFSFQRSPDLWMILFALNMAMIMMVRGSGFAIFGGSVYGGTAYLSMFLSISFYFLAVRIRLSDRYVRVLLWMLLAGALIPPIVQGAVVFLPAGAGWMEKFVAVNAEAVQREQLSESGIVRWSTLAPVAYALVPVAYVLCRRKDSRFVLIALAFVLVGMTGFRSRIFQIGALVFFAGLIFSKNRKKTLVLWILAGLAVFCLLMITAPILPRAVQRGISFIPFVPVDADIAERAALSSTWRFELWRDYCIPNVPKYLIIGRGIAHDIAQFAWLRSSWYGSSEFFYYMGRYHSGPLTLLLDLGLPGAVGFTLFFLYTVKDGWTTVRRSASKQDTLIARYYIYLTLLMSFEVFYYYFIFGDVRSGLFRLLVIAAQLRILKKNFLMEDSPKVNVQVVESSNGLPPSLKPVNRWAARRIGARR